MIGLEVFCRWSIPHNEHGIATIALCAISTECCKLGGCHILIEILRIAILLHGSATSCNRRTCCEGITTTINSLVDLDVNIRPVCRCRSMEREIAALRIVVRVYGIIDLLSHDVTLKQLYRLLHHLRTIDIPCIIVPFIHTLQGVCAALVHCVILRIAHKHLRASPHHARVGTAAY